jgi:hypothetical protein
MPRIIVVPGLAEKHDLSDRGNKTVGLDALKAAFEDKGVDFSLMTKENINLRFKDNQKAAFDNLSRLIIRNAIAGRRIAVVSHPGVMRRIFKNIANGRAMNAAAGVDPRPDNTEMWQTDMIPGLSLNFTAPPLRPTIASLPPVTSGHHARLASGDRCERFRLNADNINFSAYGSAAGAGGGAGGNYEGGRRTRRRKTRRQRRK